MLVYRISLSRFADDLQGTGAGLHGGRWNPKGINVLYTSCSLSLAYLEYLVHNMHLLKSAKMTLLKLEINAVPEQIAPNQLPDGWQENLRTSQQIGFECFLEKKVYALKVPSVIVPEENNLLLNPSHPDHRDCGVVEKVEPFYFDKRLTG